MNNMLNPKLFYYTPGLWDLSGMEFWGAFLFETPFALGRAFGGLLLFIIIFIYMYFGLKALYWYTKEKQMNHN